MNDLELTRKVKDAAMDELQKARERIAALEAENARLRGVEAKHAELEAALVAAADAVRDLGRIRK